MTWMPAPGLKVIAQASAIRTGLIVAGAALVLGFGAGWQVHGWKQAKAELKTQRAEVAAVTQENARRHDIGVRAAQQQRDIEVFYDGLPDWWRTFVAERPELDRVELGPVGLCEWNRWNAGPAAADRPCAAAEGTAGAADGRERQLPGLGAKSPGVHAPVPPHGNAAQRTDRRSGADGPAGAVVGVVETNGR